MQEFSANPECSTAVLSCCQGVVTPLTMWKTGVQLRSQAVMVKDCVSVCILMAYSIMPKFERIRLRMLGIIARLHIVAKYAFKNSIFQDNLAVHFSGGFFIVMG